MADPARSFDPHAIAALASRARALLAAADADHGAAPRILVGIAGAPGAGKTSLARAVVAALDRAELDAGPESSGPESSGPEPSVAEPSSEPFAAHLPMDGFHLANATLDRLGLRDRKGAIETFDGWGFVALLDRLRRETGHTVYAPSFERDLEEPIAGDLAIAPSVRVVVLEGNYLLADSEPWRRVRGVLDQAWFCETPADERMRRLVERHTRFGRSHAAAVAWARDVDGANARLIQATRAHADLVVSGLSGVVVS